ncbi:MAG: transglutaminase domain-containing protein [Candidatus Brocadiia bacterium]
MACARRLFPAAILMLVLMAGCSPSEMMFSAKLPGEYRSAVEKVIAQSGENGAELRKFILRFESDPPKLHAACFLVSNMPLSDSASMSADDLAEHIDYAFEARQRMPWGHKIPNNIFLHYVVAHRSSQEPPQRFRAQFFNDLAPRLEKCASMDEAALEINKWCFLQATYKPSSPRDQGPLTTIARGWGRCEEEMILYISAARSLCIPARQAYTPSWQFSNSNHAWVEVWTDGGWKYLGACEPDVRLNSAWFSGSVQRAAIIISSAYGEVAESDENVYRKGKDYTSINSTAYYTSTAKVECEAVGADGMPLSGANVFAAVFNNGTFSPVARIILDKKGRGEMEFGPCTLLFTCARDGRTDYEFVRINPPEVATVKLDLSRNRLPSGNLWMRFGAGLPPLGVVAPKPCWTPEQLGAETGRLAAFREARFVGYKQSIAAFLGKSSEEMETDPLAKAMLTAGANCSELMKAIAQAPPEIAAVLKEYISRMEDKDLLETDAGSLLNEVTTACAARDAAGKVLNLTYDDNTFFDAVLNNRIGYEGHSCWRPEFVRRFSVYAEADILLTALRVNEYTSLLYKTERGVLGSIMSPVEIARTSYVTSDMERSIAGVAILRALGIPARYVEEMDFVEFFDGKEWQPLYPADPSALGNKKATGGAEARYAEPCTVTIGFTEKGLPKPKGIDYIDHFSISKFTPDGFFRFVIPEGDYDEKTGLFELKLPPGDYFILSGPRNNIGEPYVTAIPFTAEAGAKLTYTIAWDIPEEAPLPKAHALEVLPVLSVSTVDGLRFDLHEQFKSGNMVILTFFDPASEPCVSMMPAIGALLGRKGISVLGIGMGDNAEVFRSFVERTCKGLPYVLDPQGSIAKAFGIGGKLPAIIIIGKDGKLVMWSEGINREIADLLDRALR